MLFMKMMSDGGPMMWLILFASLAAMIIFLEKWFQFHREQINVGELITGLFNVLLNLLFVLCFDMSVDGVSLATVFSNIMSMILLFIKLLSLYHMSVDTAKSDCLAALILNKVYKVFIYLSCKHHLYDVDSFLVGNAQTVNKLGLFAKARHEIADLGASAVNENDFNADKP